MEGNNDFLDATVREAAEAWFKAFDFPFSAEIGRRRSDHQSTKRSSLGTLV
jgi:hypothetical protein